MIGINLKLIYKWDWTWQTGKSLRLEVDGILNLYFEIKIINFRYDGENYNKIDESKYSHQGTYGLGNLEGRAITTGCSSGYQPECAVKTEIFDMTAMTWSAGDDFPYISER